jgi:hypothetical protein
LESEGSTWPVLTYVLQDANLNVVGLTDALGHPVAHFDYTPYGVTRTAVHGDHTSLPADLSALVTAQSNRLGHQGLRFERLDRPWESLHGEIPGVAATSVGGPGQVFDPAEVGSSSGTVTALGSFHGVYLNRNRVYEPWIGRFTSVDPNGLGLPVALAHRFTGAIPSAFMQDQLDMLLHFSDSWNTHAYAGCSPVNNRDPGGLTLTMQLGVGTIQAGLRGLDSLKVGGGTTALVLGLLFVGAAEYYDLTYNNGAITFSIYDSLVLAIESMGKSGVYPGAGAYEYNQAFRYGNPDPNDPRFNNKDPNQVPGKRFSDSASRTSLRGESLKSGGKN